MPNITFDTEVSTSTNIVVSLKSKGDKIIFRVANNPFMEEVIMTQDINGWKPLVVGRNSKAQALKNEYIDLMRKAKTLEKTGDKSQADQIRKGARKIAPKLTFYIPILNRDTGEAQILRVGKSVFDGLKAQHEAGRNLLETDFLLIRNEGDVPANYYFLDRQDTTKLTDEDKINFEKAKTFNIEAILYPPAEPSLEDMIASEMEEKTEQPGYEDEAIDEDIPF